MKARRGRGAYPSPCCGRRSEALRLDGEQVLFACSVCGKESALHPGQGLRLVYPELQLVWSDGTEARS